MPTEFLLHVNKTLQISEAFFDSINT